MSSRFHAVAKPLIAEGFHESMRVEYVIEQGKQTACGQIEIMLDMTLDDIATGST
jgi:hypothetical protein